MKYVCYCFLLVLAGALMVIGICNPSVLNENTFLHGFINHEILNAHAVVVTVSLVSISQTHLEFARVERRLGARIFDGARREINSTATVMVGSLFMMLLLLIFCGGVSALEMPKASALIRSGCLFLLAVAVLAMADVIRIAYELAGAELIDIDNAEPSEESSAEPSTPGTAGPPAIETAEHGRDPA